jgi:hypothetical protein
MQLIGVLGLIGSGKGAIADYLVSNKMFRKVSFADPVKDAAAGIFGWDRKLLQGDTSASRDWRERKDEFWSKILERPFSPRIALQEIGTEVGRNYFHPDIWLASLEFKIANLTSKGEDKFVIDDCRFQNEVEFVLKMGGKLIVVERGEKPEWWQTAYDQNSGVPVELKMEQKHRSVHPSEWKWISEHTYKNATIIPNEGTLKDLHFAIDKLL